MSADPYDDILKRAEGELSQEQQQRLAEKRSGRCRSPPFREPYVWEDWLLASMCERMGGWDLRKATRQVRGLSASAVLADDG